jgi:hypothetical protein
VSPRAYRGMQQSAPCPPGGPGGLSDATGHLGLPPSIITAPLPAVTLPPKTTTFTLMVPHAKPFNADGFPLQSLCSYFARVTITVFDVVYVCQFYTIVPLYYPNIQNVAVENDIKIANHYEKLLALSNSQMQVPDKMETEIRQSTLIQTLRAHSLQYWKLHGFNPTWTVPEPPAIIKIDDIRLFATEPVSLSPDSTTPASSSLPAPQ